MMKSHMIKLGITKWTIIANIKATRKSIEYKKQEGELERTGTHFQNKNNRNMGNRIIMAQMNIFISMMTNLGH